MNNKKSNGKRWHKPVALGVIAILLLSIALFVPWYTLTGAGASDYGGTADFNVNFYLDKLNPPDSDMKYYEDAPPSSSAQGPINIFEMTRSLTFAALAITIIFVGSVIALGKRIRSLKPAAVIGVFALLATLWPPFYLMTMLPGEMGLDSFFGSYTMEGTGGSGFFAYSYEAKVWHYGSWGWFIALIAALLVGIAVFLCHKQGTEKIDKKNIEYYTNEIEKHQGQTES